MLPSFNETFQQHMAPLTPLLPEHLLYLSPSLPPSLSHSLVPRWPLLLSLLLAASLHPNCEVLRCSRV